MRDLLLPLSLFVASFIYAVHSAATDAFNLVRIERRFEDELAHRQRLNARSIDGNIHDEDEHCQQECNQKLKTALDLVKAHTAFGSIGVPSVIDTDDLELFCKFDAENDDCLRNCGYEIQFNMRDYMADNLSCYARAASQLKRVCGSRRCGPYQELQLSIAGYDNRCKSVICDLACTQVVLRRSCGVFPGERAYKFLLDYTRVQVATWLREAAKQLKKAVGFIIPTQCSRLFCDKFDGHNCTYIAAV